MDIVLQEPDTARNRKGIWATRLAEVWEVAPEAWVNLTASIAPVTAYAPYVADRMETFGYKGEVITSGGDVFVRITAGPEA